MTRSNASRTTASTFASAEVVSTPSRIPSSVTPSRLPGFPASMIARSCAASSTLRQSGPTVSNRAQSGTTPSSESRPCRVFSPTRSFQADGVRTDPPVSDPIPAAASPKATEAAAPEDDPPDTAPASFTFGGDAVIGFTPRPEKANSVMWVLPRQTRPAALAFSSTSASRVGVRPARSFEPASVAVPAESKRSFQEIGTPSSALRRVPAFARARAASASARARSDVTRA